MHAKEPSTSSIESILCEAIKLEYETFYSVSQFNSNSRELNEAERAKLNELIAAHKALSTPVDNELNGLNGLFGEEYLFQVSKSDYCISQITLVQAFRIYILEPIFCVNKHLNLHELSENSLKCAILDLSSMRK